MGAGGALEIGSVAARVGGTTILTCDRCEWIVRLGAIGIGG
jgi:hypothetical protein